ncbi:MAG: pyridoxamine 5'-phosphate oxidase family protein [Flavisolibacter sp.]
MLGNLSDVQINTVLHTQLIGRIGCHAEGLTYVVPISYAYDGEFIYCHTREGKKTFMMRKNARVCFQVDEMQDMANWKSVILQGAFEELSKKEDINHAMHALLSRYLPMVSSTTTHLGKFWPFQSDDYSDMDGIVFRIRILEQSGRYEANIESPAMAG